MDQQFCLHWNNHRSTLITVLEQLLRNEKLVDVTLTAEGQSIGAHKIVLSACSPYFEEIFSLCGDKHPVIFLKDVKFDDVKCLLDYMYKGEVNVSEEQLPVLIQTAESLQIKGLADGVENKKNKETKEKKLHKLSAHNDQNLKADIGTTEGVPPKRMKISKKCDELLQNSEHVISNTHDKTHTEFQNDSEVSGSPEVVTDNSNDIISSSNTENTLCEETSDSKVSDLNSTKVEHVEIKSEKFEEHELHLEDTLKKESDESIAFGQWSTSPESMNNSQFGDVSEGMQEIQAEELCQEADVSRFVCNRCNRSYKYQSHYKRHKNQECGVEKQFHCWYCPAKFARSDTLKRHVDRTHLLKTVKPNRQHFDMYLTNYN